MLPFRPVADTLVGQIDVGGLAAYEDIASALAGFTVGAVVVYLVGRLLLVPTVTRVVSARNANNPTLETATRTYTHAFVVVLATLAGLIVAGFGSVLTNSALIIAALTIVFGVAGQEVIGALISGLFLVADPDFNVGDWISWPNGEGVVEAVDFRVTRVRTLNNETITVPNTELTTNALLRPYGRERYRVTERVDVAYGDDTELALLELAEVARHDDRVLEDPPPRSRIEEFGGSSIGLKAEFWVASPMDVDLVEVRSQFRRRVKVRFDEVGLTLGPPSGREVSGTLDVDLVDE
ncbi:mechanosensitive ion channel family protein [Haloferax sp. YSMS24]|uniref:mechanosensitive ion channel family protein n=1 Tax=Haloferax sp. YSMS24 TaxID=3388425 RepID=UPI00398CE3BB